MKYKQVKNGMEGFSEKPSTSFLFAYKRKRKRLKKAEIFCEIFLASIFAKSNLVFIWTLNINNLLIFTI